jgi:hypothetical protein
VGFMRKGRYKQQQSSIFFSDTLFIRIIRLLFFALIIGFFIYLYALYETDDLGSFLGGIATSVNTQVTALYISAKKLFLAHPVVSFLILINNAFFIFVGYILAKVRG